MAAETVNQSPSIPRHAFVTLIGGALAIGFSPIFVRLSEAGPTATAFWRMGFALPFLWSGMVWHDRQQPVKKRPFTRSDHLLLFLAGAFFTADLSLWHAAIGLTTIANATLLPNFFPVFVTLGAWLLLGQRVTRLFLGGLLLALIGATLLIGSSAAISQQTLIGDLLALSTAVVYSGYFLAISRLRHAFSAFTVMTWVGSIAGLLLLAETLLLGEPLFSYTLRGWLVLLGLGLVAQIAGQGLITYSLAHLPPAFSSVTMILQPLVATIVAWLLFQEALTAFQASGGVIILLGIVIARRGVGRKA